MPTVARHRRPGKGMFPSILLAVAVFWASISVGIWFGRRHGPATAPVGSPPAAGGVTGSASSSAATRAAAATGASADLLQPGDRIELRLVDGAGAGVASAQSVAVDPQGMVRLPVVGTIRAQYLTPAQLEEAIARAYKDRNLIQNGKIRVLRASGAATAPAAK